ncbi:MAG TPA: TRL domain-containing protein [Nitrospiraceae bacterium]|nr:TRL domain-containing protein [Nitrospiraceae bacterium]
MTTRVFAIPFLAVMLLTAGCMGEASPVIGKIYADVQYGMFATTAVDASKRGESCAKAILTLFAFGDATVDDRESEWRDYAGGGCRTLIFQCPRHL